MRKDYAYRWLVEIIGYSYDGLIERLEDQFEIEKKPKDTKDIKNDNSHSEKNANDFLFELLLYFHNKSFMKEKRHHPKKHKKATPAHKHFKMVELLNLKDGNTEYIPNDSNSYYYEVLYVVALLYEYCLDDSKSFGNIANLNGLHDKTNRLIETIEYIVSGSTDIPRKERKIDSMVSELSRDIQNSYNKEPYKRDELSLRFILCVFLLKVIHSSDGIDNLFRQASAKLSFEYMRRLYFNEEYRHAIRFAQFAFVNSDRLNCLQAFNIAGLSALYNKQYQVAYDMFLSWINKSMLDSLKKYYGLDENTTKCINSLLKSDEEKECRARHMTYVSLMYGNMAYVCTEIFDYLGPTERGCIFLQIAKHYNNLDLSTYETSAALYDAGRILACAHKYDEAAERFEACYKRIKDSYIDSLIRLRTATLRRLIMHSPNFSKEKSDKWLDSISRDFIRSYDQLLISNRSHSSEVILGRNLYFLLSSCRKLTFIRKRKVARLLLNIDNDAREILQCLRRRSTPYKDIDYRRDNYSEEQKKLFEVDKSSIILKIESKDDNEKEIAYYTPLENIKYLLDKESENDKGNLTDKVEANRLTMMHARYMNDPDEGLVLLDNLKDYLFVSPEELRDNLYDQKYIFLKSFTGLVDQLNMWTLYGSDRGTGKDCNGCCICFEPESFIYIPENDYSDNKESTLSDNISKHINDDYDLYNVAYVDDEELFVDGLEASEDLKNRYADLKFQLSVLHQLIKNASEEDKTTIYNCLVRLLEKPMFLFKDKSYCLEKESRIIISRDFNDRLEIKKTSAEKEPRKIFINPPLQMFPSRIILGPKVEDDDYWMPYLQYKLSEIKDKWDYEKDYNPKVRKSSINIR